MVQYNNVYIIDYVRQITGKTDLFTYNDLSKITSFELRTLYNAKSIGEIVPVAGSRKSCRFSLEQVIEYMRRKQIIPNYN